MTRPFAYYVEGIGEDFLPSTMNLKIVDEIMRVDDKECFLMTRELVRQEGLFVGGSSGAAVAGAIKYAEMSKRKENILVLLPDGAQKYLSKIFDDKWMRENGFLDEPDPLGTVAELLRSKKQRPARHARKLGENVRDVIGLMRDNGISQMPVLDDGRQAAGRHRRRGRSAQAPGEGRGRPRRADRRPGRVRLRRPSRPRRASTCCATSSTTPRSSSSRSATRSSG